MSWVASFMNFMTSPTRTEIPIYSEVNGTRNETKNVVFIGLTQNGKSTLVRSLISYAGDETLAKKVHVGDNNSSMTQTCSEYPIKAPLRTHQIRLKSSPGKPVASPDDTLRNRDIIVDVIPTNKFVRVKLIDTPGLSDSNKSEHSSSGMSILDERHKLGILVALSNISELHAVCFVVGRHEAYSGSLQEHINDLVRLFDMSFKSSSREVNYHVIHTWITMVDRFPADAETASLEKREELFKEKIKLGHTARHHFIDSGPRPKDLVGVYYSQRVLSELLEAFSTSSGTGTSGIAYPRSSAHVINDQTLLATLKVVRTHWEAERKKALNEAAEHESNKAPYQVLKSEYESQCQELRKSIASYDTAEDVYVASTSCSVETKWHEFSMKWRFMELTSATPISKVENSCTNGKFDCETQEEKKYRICLNTINYSAAYGTIKIYSQKRHVAADTIARLRAELSETELSKAGPEKLISDKDEKAKKCKADAASAQKHISEIERVSKKIDYLNDWKFDGSNPPAFKVRDFGDRLRYFTVDNLYATALAYQDMTFAVPKRFLPTQRMSQQMQVAEIEELLSSKVARRDKCCSSMGIAKARTGRWRNYIHGFEQLTDKFAKVAGLVQDGPKMVAVTVSKQEKEKLASLFVCLDAANMSLYQNAVKVLTWFGTGLPADLEVVDNQLSELAAANSGLQEELERLEGEMKILEEEQRELELSVEATGIVLREVRGESLEFGAFAAVLKAINDGARNPYLVACEDVFEALKIGRVEI